MRLLDLGACDGVGPVKAYPLEVEGHGDAVIDFFTSKAYGLGCAVKGEVERRVHLEVDGQLLGGFSDIGLG